MKNSEKMKRWNGYAASIPGSGHIRRGIPCQDASLVLTSPRPALIVCDGRGSAKLSLVRHSRLTAARYLSSWLRRAPSSEARQ